MMELQIVRATDHNKTLIWRILQLYLHDLSPFIRENLNDQGEYDYPYFDQYWCGGDRQAYIIKLTEQPVGFAFVNSQNILSDSKYSIAEFFILRSYRKQGLGKIAAGKIFNQHPGIWEVRVIQANQPANKFWKVTITNFTEFAYKEINGIPGWNGPIFQFDSKRNRRRCETI